MTDYTISRVRSFWEVAEDVYVLLDLLVEEGLISFSSRTQLRGRSTRDIIVGIVRACPDQKELLGDILADLQEEIEDSELLLFPIDSEQLHSFSSWQELAKELGLP